MRNASAGGHSRYFYSIPGRDHIVQYTIDDIAGRLQNARRSGEGWQACCPSHNDTNASLSISRGDDGRVLLHCHAGCSLAEICNAMDVRIAGLMPTDLAPTSMAPHGEGYTGGSRAGRTGGRPEIVATYDYCDETGSLLFQVLRMHPKDFRQRQPEAGGGWKWSTRGVRPVPYRLPQLLAAPQDVVFIPEGEKDVDNLAAIKLLATCNHGGAGKWKAGHSAFLRGRHVAVLPDNGDAGQQHARSVAVSLHGVAASIKVLQLPGLPAKGDVSDWLDAGGDRQQLLKLVQASPVWDPAAEPWPDIEPLNDVKLPAFPVNALTPVLREWVKAEAHATQTPPAMAGLLALAVCSAAIARRVTVQPRPGWNEPVNLFVAVLMEPASRKSAVFSDACQPLEEYEAEIVEDARPDVERAQSEDRQDQARLKKLERLAVDKDDQQARQQAADLAAELSGKLPPVLPKLIVSDTTTERLAMLLEQQGGRIASLSAEGDVFDLIAGRYSKNGNADFNVYLKGHAGDRLTQSRVSRCDLVVDRPALTCAYAVQPSVITSLQQQAAYRDRGLLARFLYAVPPSLAGEREIAAAAVPAHIATAYRRTVRRLMEFNGEFLLTFAADAEQRLRQWEQEIETMLRDGGDLETIRDWGGKLAGATVRIAGVLHCSVCDVMGEIDQRTVDDAIAIARYLIPHAEHVLNATRDDTVTADARYLLRWITRNRLDQFTHRDAHAHGRRRFTTSDELLAPLELLHARGYIRPRPDPPRKPGRRPSTVYAVNPAAFA